MGRPRGSKNRKTLEREAMYAQMAEARRAALTSNINVSQSSDEVERMTRNTVVKAHHSLGSLLDAFNAGGDYYGWAGRDWAGGRTKAEALRYMQQGATHAEMKPALDLINKVDASFRDREVSAWQPSVCGAYPMVPDYLMGLPESMRQRKPQENDIAPIKIVVESAISAGLSESANMRRGAAIAALIMRMSEARPIDLYFCYAGLNRVTNRTAMLSVKVDSTPVALSQIVAAFSLTFCRQVILSNVYNLLTGTRNGLSWAFGQPSSQTSNLRARCMRHLMGLVPPDILIQGGYLPDAKLMDTDPVAWVHKQLEKQRAVDDMLAA